MSPDGATPSTGFASGSTIDLAVTGMTCAACAARIERRLNRVPGLEATVNYATERARITVDAELLDERGVGGVLDDCVATIVWKKTTRGWREARWHGSVVSSDVPDELQALTADAA